MNFSMQPGGVYLGRVTGGCVQVVSFPRSFVSKEGNVKLQLAPHSLQPRVCAEVGTQRASSCLPSSPMSPSLVLRLAVGWKMGGGDGACSSSSVGSRIR